MAELSEHMSAAAYQAFLTRTGTLPMTEGELHLEIRRALTLHSWRFYHTYNSRRSVPGLPDLVAIKPPRLLFIELKSPTGVLIREQQAWLETLGQIPGLEVYVLASCGPRRGPRNSLTMNTAHSLESL